MKFIFEAYEGIAVLSTIDPVKGIVELHVAPGCDSTAQRIIEDLGKEILIEPLTSAHERNTTD